MYAEKNNIYICFKTCNETKQQRSQQRLNHSNAFVPSQLIHGRDSHIPSQCRRVPNKCKKKMAIIGQNGKNDKNWPKTMLLRTRGLR